MIHLPSAVFGWIDFTQVVRHDSTACLMGGQHHEGLPSNSIAALLDQCPVTV
jgi:hypothetical protein